MNNKVLNWKSIDGLKMFAQTWEPKDEVKAVINLVHGMGEHSGRYYQWAKKFAEQGIAVISFDHRGHGNSEGKRGHSPSYDSLMNDIDLLFQKSEELYPNVPVFLYGHSLGGNLVLNYVLRKAPKIAGVIATSPWLKLTEQPPKMLLAFAKMMKSIIPSLSQSTNLDPSFISKDEKEVELYAKDKLVHGKITVGMFLDVVEAGIWAIENARKLKNKALICHGTDDKITSHKASLEFADKVQDSTEVKLYDDAYHELHHENIRETLFQDILNWMELKVGV